MSTNTAIDVYQGPGGYRAVLPEARIYGDGEVGVLNNQPTETRTDYPAEERQGLRWAYWGADDAFPRAVRNKIELVPMAGQAIYRRVAMLYGNGLAYFRNSDYYSAEGNRIPRAKLRKIDDWLRRNRIKTQWLIPQAADYSYYMNAFSEMIFSQDGRQVSSIYHKTAEHCRLTVQDEESLRSEWMLFSRQFGCDWPRDENIARIPLFDWARPEEWFRRNTGWKMAWHSRFETPGSLYYARPFWIGLFRKDGWLDVSANVPRIVNAMMKNQMILKYQILVPDEYFRVRYPEWDSKSFDEQQKLFDTLVKRINDTLTGTDNAYKTLSQMFHENQGPGGGGEGRGKIEIIAIDDKMKKDQWVPSSEKSDAQIVQGLGVHPSQLGLAPEGGKMGAGSGSDQREAFNTAITLNTIDQEVLLEPLNWIARYNAQYDPDWDVTFFIDHTWHTTTNQQETGLQPSDTTLEIK